MEWFAQVGGWLSGIYDFITSGIYVFFTDLLAKLLNVLIKFQYWVFKTSVEFAWDVANQFVDDLRIGQTISNALSGLPLEIAQAANYFRVPEAVNNILSGLTTRYILKLAGIG